MAAASPAGPAPITMTSYEVFTVLLQPVRVEAAAGGSAGDRLHLCLERALLDLLARHPLAHLRAVPVEHEGRAAGHAEARRELAVALPEDLEEPGPAGEGLGDGVVFRGESLAGRTLRRVEVEDDGALRGDHLALVVLLADLLHVLAHVGLLSGK